MPGALLNSLSRLATCTKRDHSCFTDGKLEDEGFTAGDGSLNNSWHSGGGPGAGQHSTAQSVGGERYPGL